MLMIQDLVAREVGELTHFFVFISERDKSLLLVGHWFLGCKKIIRNPDPYYAL